LINYAIKVDATISISFLVKIDELRKRQEIKSKFVEGILEIIERNLSTEFEMFLGEQLRGIGEYRVNVKKRCGILDVFRSFQQFIPHMEGILGGTEAKKARDLVDNAYKLIAEKLLDILNSINNSMDQYDEKEALNAHIIITENSQYFVNDFRMYEKLTALTPSIKQAKQIYEEHLSLYVKNVIQTPLGKLLEFFDGIDNLLLTRKDEEIGYQLSYNKNALKKVIAQYPGPTIRKNLETLFRRVEKHFPGSLATVVWGRIQKELMDKHKHFEEIISRCYPQSEITLGFQSPDILFTPEKGE